MLSTHIKHGISMFGSRGDTVNYFVGLNPEQTTEALLLIYESIPSSTKLDLDLGDKKYTGLNTLVVITASDEETRVLHEVLTRSTRLLVNKICAGDGVTLGTIIVSQILIVSAPTLLTSGVLDEYYHFVLLDNHRMRYAQTVLKSRIYDRKKEGWLTNLSIFSEVVNPVAEENYWNGAASVKIYDVCRPRFCVDVTDCVSPQEAVKNLVSVYGKRGILVFVPNMAYAVSMKEALSAVELTEAPLIDIYNPKVDVLENYWEDTRLDKPRIVIVIQTDGGGYVELPWVDSGITVCLERDGGEIKDITKWRLNQNIASTCSYADALHFLYLPYKNTKVSRLYYGECLESSPNNLVMVSALFGCDPLGVRYNEDDHPNEKKLKLAKSQLIACGVLHNDEKKGLQFTTGLGYYVAAYSSLNLPLGVMVLLYAAGRLGLAFNGAFASLCATMVSWPPHNDERRPVAQIGDVDVDFSSDAIHITNCLASMGAKSLDDLTRQEKLSLNISSLWMETYAKILAGLKRTPIPAVDQQCMTLVEDIKNEGVNPLKFLIWAYHQFSPMVRFSPTSVRIMSEWGERDLDKSSVCKDTKNIALYTHALYTDRIISPRIPGKRSFTVATDITIFTDQEIDLFTKLKDMIIPKA